MGVDGKGLRALVTPSPRDGRLGSPLWSPTGDALAFTTDGFYRWSRYGCFRQDASRAALRTVGADGVGQRKVVAAAGRDLPAALKPIFLFVEDWSADGKTFLYVEERYSDGECRENYYEGFTLRSVPGLGRPS